MTDADGASALLTNKGSLGGLRTLVTGGGSGIGLEVALALAEAGAEVSVGVRNVAAADAVRRSRGDLRVLHLDLLDQQSINQFCNDWSGPLHLLINNAAVMAVPESRTSRGWEYHFATNHLGHFLLANGLHRNLAAAAPARVISVSSSAHMRSPVVFDDIHFRFRAYDPWMAYAQSKTANILFAVGAAARWNGDGIAVNAIMPGVAWTNLQRHLPPSFRIPPEREQTVAQVADPVIFLAVHPSLANVSGRYFVGREPARIASHRTEDGTGVAPYAIELNNADRLWQVSEDHWAR